MNETEKEDPMLEAYFSSARAETAPVTEDFVARVLADASTIGAEYVAAPLPRSVTRRSLFARLADPVGGWRGAAALAASAVIGIMIGYTDTAGVDALLVGLADATSTETGLGDATPFDTLFLEV